MLGALWLFLSVYIKQVENFAGAMNFVMFPMFFFSSALYPLWRLREGGSELIYLVSLVNPFTHAVELIRFALYGMLEPTGALVVSGATVVFFLLRQTLADLGAIYLLILGAVAIIVMLKAPKGLWGLIADRYGWQLFPLERRLVIGEK